MKIGYINNFGNYPPQGGSSVHVYQVLKGFIAAGHEVHALQGDYPFENFVKYKNSGLQRFIENIDLLYIRLGGGLRQDILSLLQQRRKSSVPLVWEINAPAFERQNFKSGIVDAVWKIMSNNVDGAICVSEELKEYIQERYNIKKVIFVPNGSDPVLFAPQKANRSLFPEFAADDFLVLWAGSSQFSWQGVDLIYDVAEKMLKENTKIKFVLISQPEHLKRTPLQNMKVMGRVPYLSIACCIASVDVCLAPYQDVPWSPIGFYFSPLKLFDYMACAKPVIATAAGQIKNVIAHEVNGLLTDSTSQDIVEKILFLYKNQEKAVDMGQRARAEVIRYYNWNRVVDETLNLFETIKNGK